jgi:hypothetical protein
MGNENVLDALVAAIAPRLAEKMGNKGATGTPTTYYAHGPAGLFSTCGVEQDVISSVVTPQGILAYMLAYPNVNMYPLFQYITGFRDDTGNEPDAVCDNCKTAGLKKGCLQTAQFGRYCRETRELSVERLYQRNNRGEMDDLRLINPVFNGTNPLVPARTNQDPFKSEVAQALLEVGVSLERLLSRQVWIGNPTNNSGTGYLEFPGLEILVSTGKVDAISNTSCPSLDSDIKEYNYQDVCTGAPSIVEVASYLYRYLSKNARTMNLEPVDFRWVMREELFYELTSCWPCSYTTYRCSNTDTAGRIDPVGTFDAAQMVKFRDDMRNGRYLLVDGKQIPVILDDGIPEDTATNNANLNPGEFSSDIYLLPFSVRGGIASLYMEFVDFSKTQPDINLAGFNNDYQVTDGGKYMWIKDKVRGCFLLQAVIRPRVILRTPHLAGRINNVKYTPLQHTREPFPSDGYFVNGGVVERSTPSYYSEWRSQE